MSGRGENSPWFSAVFVRLTVVDTVYLFEAAALHNQATLLAIEILRIVSWLLCGRQRNLAALRDASSDALAVLLGKRPPPLLSPE